MYEVIVKLCNFKFLKIPGLALMFCTYTFYFFLLNFRILVVMLLFFMTLNKVIIKLQYYEMATATPTATCH